MRWRDQSDAIDFVRVFAIESGIPFCIFNGNGNFAMNLYSSSKIVIFDLFTIIWFSYYIPDDFCAIYFAMQAHNNL